MVMQLTIFFKDSMVVDYSLIILMRFLMFAKVIKHLLLYNV